MLRATSLGLLAALALTAGVALAQPRGSTSYEVGYQSVADDCAGQGMTLSKGQVTLRQTDGEQLRVDIAGVGALTGTRNANGRFKAQGTGAQGDLEARLSVSGRADGNQVQMIFIAEFYRGKKPVCTQSWSGQGRRR